MTLAHTPEGTLKSLANSEEWPECVAVSCANVLELFRDINLNLNLNGYLE